MKRTIITEKNASITIPGERVVVAGGTQGIGGSIAYRFAQAGAEVWIIGRNETKGVKPPLLLSYSSHRHLEFLEFIQQMLPSRD